MAFTLTAGIALIFNGWFLLRSWLRLRRLNEAHLDGQLRHVAVSFVQIWASVVAADLFMFLAGVGLLSGARPLGYLLAVMPLTSVLVGVFALRGF